VKTQLPKLKNIALSLEDPLGPNYVRAVCEAQAFVTGGSPDRWMELARRKVDFWPAKFQRRADALVGHIGQSVTSALAASSPGAGTDAFNKATKHQAAPLTGLGFLRVGEDGRLYLAAKCEHYHAPLGHQFPGYRLLDIAARIGVLNATHNTTRGHITRLLERELIRTANGLGADEDDKLDAIVRGNEPHVLSKVINLQTGSLVLEAAIKMMLARFYKLEATFAEPRYAGRVPVFLVIADNNAGREANYHGTTVLAQTLRGMWPGLTEKIENAGILRIRQVAMNDLADFTKAVAEFERPPFKVAGFFHELILMNYGGIRLSEDFLRGAYRFCRERDIPTMADEIQSCMWSPQLFLFREYGLQPDFVSVGKGFPGGQYCASRLLLSGHMDNLNLFGALVTNGQEELASLAYLITMAFARANSDYTAALGDYYHGELRRLGERHSRIVTKIEGQRHLATVFFATADQAVRFSRHLNARGIDISAQTYKANCPPSALTKIPLISSKKMVDFLIARMDEALRAMS
jgi:4-aminobutyrate aminotransferase-like enzyme